MTFKHIDFHSSSVMRELERQALKSGKISSPTVTEIVKKASVGKRFASSGDLFIDLVHLAEGLREKGFLEAAASLENKILSYKRAAQEYNSELSTAHPDGDASMGEASNGLGDVETLESAHEKMLEVVKKNPTGKQANVTQHLVANILKASEEALGLKKKAQDPAVGESAEDVFSGKNASREIVIKEINGYLAKQFPKISSILRSHDVNPVKWVFRYADLLSGTQAFRALYASRAGLNQASIEKFLQDNEKLYGKDFSGDEQSQITSTLQTYAKSKDVNKLLGYAGIVGNGVANKYFIGSQPSPAKKEYAASNPEKSNNQMFKDNPNSIWKWNRNISQGDFGLGSLLFSWDDFVVDEGKLMAAASEMQQVHFNDFQALFGEDKLNAATAKIQEELKAILGPLTEVSTLFEKNPELPPNAASTASLNMAINSQIEKLKPYDKNGALYKKLLELATIMWPGWTPNLSDKATEAANEIVATVNFLNSKPLGSGDIVIRDTSSAVVPLMGAAKMYFEALKQVNPKSQTHKDYTLNQNVTFNLAKALKANAGKPYASLFEVVKKVFPQATTYDKLVQEAQNWLQESSDITGYPIDEFKAVRAAEKLTPGIQKVAQGLVRKKPSGPNVPAHAEQEPAQGTPAPQSAQPAKPNGGVNRAALGLAKANMNDPKEVAVATMQQYLAYFAEALSGEAAKSKFKDYDPQDVARLVRTGPKANPAVNTYDGKWGTQTQAALELANKYLKQLGIAEMDSRARYVNKATSADAESVAKKNASLLSQGVQILGGKGNLQGQSAAGSNTVYDRLPNEINWASVEYPSSQHVVPVTAKDMSTLASLYDFIIKYGYAQPKYMKDDQGFDVEGLTAGNLLFIVRWFQRRAQFVYNSVMRTDKAAANLAKQYYDAAKRLEGQLAAFLTARGGITPESSKTIVDIEALREYGGSGGANGTVGEDGFQGRGRRTPGGAGYRGQGNGQGGEGTDWRMPNGGSSADDEGPPIGPDGVINLASRWFNGLDEKLGISHNPLLNPDLFKRYTAADLAKTFYANAGGNMDDQARRQALVASGVEVEGYDEAAGDYIVLYYDPITRRKQRTYAMRVPAYQRAYKARLMAGPMRSFGALLQSISAALAPAIAEWMRATQPNDAAKQAEQAWHTEWQRILGLRANEAAGV